MVSAWISFSLGFFLGRGGSAGFFSQTLRFVDILLGHSPPSEDTTLSCLVKTKESLGEKGHIVAVRRQGWDAADWTNSQLFCWAPTPASLTAMGACTTLWMFSDAQWHQKYSTQQWLSQGLGSLVQAFRGLTARQTFPTNPSSPFSHQEPLSSSYGYVGMVMKTSKSSQPKGTMQRVYLLHSW